MTRQELARDAGVTEQTIFRIENNENASTRPDTIIRIFRALENRGEMSEEDWARFQADFEVSPLIRVKRNYKPDPIPSWEEIEANPPSAQLAALLRNLDSTRARALRIVFDLCESVDPEKVVEHLKVMSHVLTGKVAPGTLVHRQETIKDGYRVTELSPYENAPSQKAPDAKTRAKKIGG